LLARQRLQSLTELTLPARRRTAAGQYGIKNLYDVSSRPAWYSSGGGGGGRGRRTARPAASVPRRHGAAPGWDEYVNMTPMF